MSTILSVLAAAAIAATPASSQPACDAERISQVDRDGDGVITRLEVRAARTEAFAQLDRDGDGVAAMSDAPRLFRGRYAQALEPLLVTFDANGDDRLSEAEFIDGPMPAFELGDLNGDGGLNEAEREALREVRCSGGAPA